MATILQLVVTIILVLCVSGRVIEITNNNVHLVIKSVGQLLLLLNNPQCPHSQAYTDKYIGLNTTDTVGLADCSKDKQLCNYLNISHYPTLLLVSNQKVQHINQNQFLLKNNLITPQSSQITLQHVLKLLKDEKKWVAVVLEEEKMPPIDKLGSSLQKRVVYVSNPSRLHSALTKMVGDQLGCWILNNNNGTFNRYYCGTGYKSDELQKHLNNFVNNKLERHLFTKEQKSTYLESHILSGLISELGRKTSQCKLVYFHSTHCQHCDLADYELVKTLAGGNSYYQQHGIQVFDLDREEYPQGLHLKRVPELVELCKGKIRYFGEMFTIEKLKNFLKKETASKDVEKQVQNEL